MTLMQSKDNNVSDVLLYKWKFFPKTIKNSLKEFKNVGLLASLSSYKLQLKAA